MSPKPKAKPKPREPEPEDREEETPELEEEGEEQPEESPEDEDEPQVAQQAFRPSAPPLSITVREQVIECVIPRDGNEVDTLERLARLVEDL